MKHLPFISVDVIPHSEQEYDTCGNYGGNDECWWIEISKLPKWQCEALVLIHELVEMVLTERRNISWKKITEFDNQHPNSDEPGNLLDAPYHKEHLFATRIEAMLAKELGVQWKEYDKAINKLVWRQIKKN